MIYGEKKMAKYLVNGFSPNMLSQSSDISFQAVDEQEFCANISTSNNAIGHDGTVSLINTMCNTQIATNRVMVKVQPGDIVYIINIGVRLSEGKVLTYNELEQLLKDGKIQFWKATAHQPVLHELAQCYKKCDEREYDHLASIASGQN